MSWIWRLESQDGTALTDPASPTHPSQSDAESWLGEAWRTLLEQGVAQVSLLHDGAFEYGPMPLTQA